MWLIGLELGLFSIQSDQTWAFLQRTNFEYRILFSFHFTVMRFVLVCHIKSHCWTLAAISLIFSPELCLALVLQYRYRVRRKMVNIPTEPAHPGHKLFDSLSWGQGFRAVFAKISNHRVSFFPQIVSLMNTMNTVQPEKSATAVNQKKNLCTPTSILLFLPSIFLSPFLPLILFFFL